MFINSFGIKTTLLESLRNQKRPSKAIYLGKTNYKVIVFVRNDVLRLVGVPNEFLRFTITYYMFK